jgi:hypothetical protein
MPNIESIWNLKKKAPAKIRSKTTRPQAFQLTPKKLLHLSHNSQLTFSLLSHPPDTTRLEALKNPTDRIGASWTPICWCTPLGGDSPSRHIRTALSAPHEKTVDPSAEKQVSSAGDLFSWLTCALGWAWTGAFEFAGLAWTSHTRTPESQLDETKKLAVGDQLREEIPSVPACGMLQSFGAIDFGLPEEADGDPKVAILLFFLWCSWIINNKLYMRQ